MRLADQFKAEPTLENYLLHRRSLGGSGVDSAHLTTDDPILSIESELRQYDINPAIFSDVLDGNDHKIDELCLRLIEKLVERRALQVFRAGLALTVKALEPRSSRRSDAT